MKRMTNMKKIKMKKRITKKKATIKNKMIYLKLSAKRRAEIAGLKEEDTRNNKMIKRKKMINLKD